MANQSDINAGRAVIGVALDDSSVEQQMRAVSARMKAAAAGLSAATIPVLAADVTGPAKQYEEALKTVEATYKTGMVSADQYEQQLKEIAQQYTANATPAQRLGVELANLDGQMRRGDISAAEYDRQMNQLAAQFRATAGPVDQFEASIVALDRDLKTGAITQNQYKQGLIAAQTEFRNTATPAQQYDAEIRTLNAQLAQGRITQQAHTEAVQRAKIELANAEKAARSKGSSLDSLKTQVMALGAGYLSFTSILNTVGQALEYVRGEVEKAKQSQDALVDSRRRLAQVATSEQDLAGMLERADAAAQRFGVTREKAYQALFSARSEGFEADFERLLQVSPIVESTAAAGVAGQVPGLFRATENVSTEEAISATLMAAQASRLDFESLAKSMPQAAEGAAIAKASFAETAAVLSVLASRFKSGETAADRIKAFATKAGISEDFAGQGIIGAFEALTAAGEVAQREFLGQSNELNAAFTILGEEMPVIKQRAIEIQQELERIRSGGPSMLERQRAIATADPAELARIERNAAAIARERANEAQLAAEGSAQQVARDRALAEMKRSGATGALQYPAEKAAAFATLIGGNEAMVDRAARGGATVGAIFTQGLVGGFREMFRSRDLVPEIAEAAAEAAEAAAEAGAAEQTTAERPWETAGQVQARAEAAARREARAREAADDLRVKAAEEEEKRAREAAKAEEAAAKDRSRVLAEEERRRKEREGEAEEERRRLADEEMKRRAREHADQRGNTVGWRLGAQFGTDQVAKDQLSELKRIATATGDTKRAIERLHGEGPTYS